MSSKKVVKKQFLTKKIRQKKVVKKSRQEKSSKKVGKKNRQILISESLLKYFNYHKQAKTHCWLSYGLNLRSPLTLGIIKLPSSSWSTKPVATNC